MQPSDLKGTVNQQSWDWLLDLPDRLNVVIEMIDAQEVPVFPPGSSAAATAIRRMLTTGEPSLALAISEVRPSTTPMQVTVNGLLVLCFGLSPGGVLALARELTGDDSAADVQQDLERIGSWLTAAIEASLTNPSNTIAVEPYRMHSLQRLLSEAMSRGSVRRVIGAFVEALGVWNDVRIRCYAAGASGRFFPYVSPVGAPSTIPAELDNTVVPRVGRMVRLSRAEVDRLGLASERGDVLVRGLLTGADVVWLFIFSGTIDGREQVRLTLYSEMLRESLKDALETSTNHVIAEMSRHQLTTDEPLEEAAEPALRRLAAAVGAHQAALVVTTTSGQQALAVGHTDLLLALDDHARPNRLVVTSSDAKSVMTIVVGRDQVPFTSFERAIVKAGLTVLHPWVQAALERPKHDERRLRFRPVDTLFDQLAAEAVDSGQKASVIVASVDPSVLRPGQAPTWLGGIRAQLRAGDFAGILSDSEIAVLLCDASEDQAAVVCARLRQLIESDDSSGIVLQPALGMMTRSPESPFEGSLVGAARASAAALR